MDKATAEKFLKESDILLLNLPTFKYFGILSYGLKKQLHSAETMFDTEGIPPGTCLGYTDGTRVVYCYDLLENRSDILFTTLHELLHIILSHVLRKHDRDGYLWNIACDHVVNSMIKNIASNSNKIELPKNIVLFEDLELSHPNASAEVIYDLLLNVSKSQDGQINVGGDPDGDGKGRKLSKQYKGTVKKGKDGVEYLELEDQNGNKIVISMDTDLKNAAKIDNVDGGEKGDGQPDVKIDVSLEDYEKICKALGDKAKFMWNSDSGTLKGDMPGWLQSYLDEIYKIEMPWEVLAESAILYNVQAVKRRSWSQKNIYIRKVRVPGKYQRDTDKKIFLGVIDTSGSISNDELKKFSGIIASTLNNFHGLYLIYHDTDIANEVIYEKKPNEAKLYDDLRVIKGRGGTSHRKVFERISTVVEDYDVSLMAFMTDFYSDVLECYHDHHWLREYPSIWFITNNKSVTDDVLKTKMEGCDVRAININSITDNRTLKSY